MKYNTKISDCYVTINHGRDGECITISLGEDLLRSSGVRGEKVSEDEQVGK